MAFGKDSSTKVETHATVEVSKEGDRTLMDWKLGKLLGSGGFAWVLKGTKSKSGKTCALKFTKIVDKEKHYNSYVHQQRQIQTELNIARSVKHKNIISLISFRKVNYVAPDGSTYLTYCFALEYCHRVDLFDFIYYTGKFEEPLAREIFRQIAAGVNALHQAGYAHRDIKSQNVLFTESMEVKLTDFGGSKEISEELMKTYKVGTRGHQAPELLLRRRYTKQCDVFSLGVLLFILTTGGPPFRDAVASDPWFRPLCKRPAQCCKFWKNHKRVGHLSKNVKSLIEGLIRYQPAGRLLVKDVLLHPWLDERRISPEAYVMKMKERKISCERIMDTSTKIRHNKFEGMY